MDITYSESEHAVRDALRDLLRDAVPIAAVAEAERSRAFPRAIWQRIAEQGWFGVGLPEAVGGSGTGLVEWAIVLEELGRVACPAPVVEQLAAAMYLDAVGVHDALPSLLAGDTTASVAVQDRPGAPVVAHPAGDMARLDGEKMLVPYLDAANLLLVSTGAVGSMQYFTVATDAPGVQTEPLHTVSRDQHGLLRLKSVPARGLGGSAGDPRRDLFEIYRLARDAYVVGLMGRMLDMTVEYTKQRVQFDRPIGSFQAVQYRCVDMALACYGAQSQLYQAAWLVGNGQPARRELLMCHAQVRSSAGEVVAHAHQAHGAMGFTSEYPLHHFSRRAKAYQNSLGTVAELREQLAELERELPFREADEPMWGGFF